MTSMSTRPRLQLKPPAALRWAVLLPLLVFIIGCGSGNKPGRPSDTTGIAKPRKIMGTVTITVTATNTATNTMIYTNLDIGTVTKTATGTATSTMTQSATGTLTGTITRTNTTTVTNTLTDTTTLTSTSIITMTDTIIVTSTTTSTSTNTATIILSFPKGLDVNSMSAAANGTLTMADRAKAKKPNGSPGAMANAGNSQTDIGVLGNVGNLTSLASVSLRSNALVDGDVKTAGIITKQQGARITGTSTQYATLTPLSLYAWSTVLPSSNLGDISLYAGSGSATLNPGAYANVTAYSRTNLTLTSGTYYMKSFDIEPQATLTLNMMAGPITIYVTGSIIFRGAMVQQGGSEGEFLLVELGNADVTIEKQFTGSIVAPKASLTLGSTVPMTMRGWFYGRNLVVRTDTLLIGLPFPAQSIVKQGCNCNNSTSGGDEDHDGVPNCIDNCPYNPDKTEPGVCGCQTPETDNDLDLVPNCQDNCPNDPDKTTPGQCGCKGMPSLKPAGTPCSDSAGPQTNPTCDGAGTCGINAISSPATGAKSIQWKNNTYWIVGVWEGQPKSRQAADIACKAKGMNLLRIETLEENDYLRRLINKPIWLGANAITSPGVWRWATPTSNDGAQFWSGGPNGTHVGDLFSMWAKNAPQGGQCAAMNVGSGTWQDANCATELGYICEYDTPIGIHIPETVKTVPQPARPITSCIPAGGLRSLPMPAGPTDADIGAAQAQLIQQIQLADAGIYTGAAALPPDAGSRCPFEEQSYALGVSGIDGVGCQLRNHMGLANECMSDGDCAKYGDAGYGSYVCRVVPMGTCDPTEGGILCDPHTICGQLDCSALTDNQPCDEINLCNPGSEFDAGVDPDSRLDAVALNPAALFVGGPVDASPSLIYQDEPTDAGGINHAWCRMRTQHPESVPTADQPNTNQKLETQKGAPISLDFDPELKFTVDPKPLAFGEANLSLEATAGIGATVTVNNFLGMSHAPMQIMKAAAHIEAKRCTVSTAGTTFQVFGLEADLKAMGVPMINTEDPASPLYSFSKKCDQAVKKYETYAGRAKKAFRDSQQLLKQFHDAKNLGQALNGGDFCSVLDAMNLDVPGFPGGARCWPNETMASAINRFIEYYQGPGSGQIAMLVEASKFLQKISSDIRKEIAKLLKLGDQNISLSFLNISHTQSDNLINANFAIGPIPCVIQVDLATQYGIDGHFDLTFNFPMDLFSGPGEPMEFARASANVLPHAGAALAAFVGAGVDYSVFSANIGIEGVISLAEIRAPVFAGAGLSVQVVQDFRELSVDLKPPISIDPLNGSPYHFGVPKSFKFGARYDYGASLVLQNVLGGVINARVRIKICFFSRTWRKQIIKFNGWGKTFDLIKGGGSADISIGQKSPRSDNSTSGTDHGPQATVASGNDTTMGLSESEVPLVQLAYLPEDQELSVPPPVDAGAPVPVSWDKLEKPFYDKLCCVNPPEPCQLNGTAFPACCGNAVCVVPPNAPFGSSGTCQPECIPEGSSCLGDAGVGQCCTGLRCGSGGVCEGCMPYGSYGCSSDSDCCPGAGLYCDTTTIPCIYFCNYRPLP
jgi:hypothetical protein